MKAHSSSSFPVILSAFLLLIHSSVFALEKEEGKKKSETTVAGDVTIHTTETKEKMMVGWIEKVKIEPENLVMHAKLAPGTETSSIGAENVKSFKKKGEKWIKFDLVDRKGKKQTLKRKLIRIAKIKRPGNDPIERFTIKLELCVGNTFLEEEVTIADRTGFEYELLIGRSFLAGNLTIDPSLSYTVKPSCR